MHRDGNEEYLRNSLDEEFEYRKQYGDRTAERAMHRDDNYYMDINCFNSMHYLSKPGSHRVFRIYTVAIAPYKNSAREMPTSDQTSAKLES
jgi:hypothetical protein